MDAWPKGLSPSEFGEWMNAQSGDGTLMATLSMRVVEIGVERAIVELPVRAGLRTATNNFMHAGTILSLADTAATWASVGAYRGELEPGEIPVAVFTSSQIVGNANEGRLIAEATASHPGRTLMAVSTRVTDDTGRLVALVNSTHFVRPR